MKDREVKRIRELRRKGLTYQQIAERVGCAISTAYKYSKDINMEKRERGRKIKERKIKEEKSLPEEEQVTMVVYGILMRKYSPPQISREKIRCCFIPFQELNQFNEP